MTTQPKPRMTVDEFLAWAEGRPGRHELHNGQIVTMSAERTSHLEMKGRVYRSLFGTIEKAKLPCHVLPDGASVRISETSCYEPDALVYCGPKAPPNTIEIGNPVVVVEVTSPSTAQFDAARKLVGYFKVPSVVHYLIFDPEEPPVVHHQRQSDGTILTRLVPGGEIRLDPPALVLDTTNLYPST